MWFPNVCLFKLHTPTSNSTDMCFLYFYVIIKISVQTKNDQRKKISSLENMCKYYFISKIKYKWYVKRCCWYCMLLDAASITHTYCCRLKIIFTMMNNGTYTDRLWHNGSGWRIVLHGYQTEIKNKYSSIEYFTSNSIWIQLIYILFLWIFTIEKSYIFW